MQEGKGLLGHDAPTQETPKKAPSGFQDPTIQEFASRFEKGVPEQLRPAYNAVVAAGLKLMFSEQTSRFIVKGGEGLTGGAEDIDTLVGLVQQLLATLWQASKEKMRPEAAAFGIQMLALHGLDFYDRIGAIQITPEFLGQFWPRLAQAITSTFGYSQEQISGAIRRGQQEIMSQQGGTPHA